MNEMKSHLNGFTLLPAKPGTCTECATAHAAELPHNQQSLFYQYHFYGEHGRWPTWDDAMAHCTPEMKARWTRALADLKVSTTTNNNRNKNEEEQE